MYSFRALVPLLEILVQVVVIKKEEVVTIPADEKIYIKVRLMMMMMPIIRCSDTYVICSSSPEDLVQPSDEKRCRW